MKVLANNPWLTVFLIHFFAFTLAHAEGIRTIHVDSDKIHPVYLALGKSTILRFKDRPKKVVVGNQNYFGIEYIDNDLAIQPQGVVKTNLFVYTETRVYGFHLVVGQGRQDDLVRVEWQPPTTRPDSKAPIIFDKRKEFKGQSFLIGKSLTAIPQSIQYSKSREMYFLDLQILNRTKDSIDLSKLKLIATRGDLAINPQLLVKETDKIPPNKNCKLRLFFGSKNSAALTVNAELEGKKSKFIVSEKFL